jgi:K+-sensing histidine kinase KdpD
MKLMPGGAAKLVLRYGLVTMTLAFAVSALIALTPHINQTTVALSLLLVVVGVAVGAGRGPALYAGVLAGLAFNFFFIEPLHTFRIHNLEDSIAFLALIVTAIVVGQLSHRLERRGALVATQKVHLEQAQAQLEKEAEDAEGLRRSERLKSALLDAVTHDLRSPLTSIKAAATTLRNANTSPAVRDEMAEVVEQEVDRLNLFIQNMMDLARLQAGELTLESREVTAEEIIEDALDRAQPLLEGIEVETHAGTGIPALRVDPRLLSQVVYTLVENAVKHGQGGHRIRVAAGPADGERVRFAVTDEGAGIAPSMREQVFERFFRGANGHGYGMGLAVARGIVQAHGGRIWAEAGPGGKGACLVFEVPVGAAQ